MYWVDVFINRQYNRLKYGRTLSWWEILILLYIVYCVHFTFIVRWVQLTTGMSALMFPVAWILFSRISDSVDFPLFDVIQQHFTLHSTRGNTFRVCRFFSFVNPFKAPKNYVACMSERELLPMCKVQTQFNKCFAYKIRPSLGKLQTGLLSTLKHCCVYKALICDITKACTRRTNMLKSLNLTIKNRNAFWLQFFFLCT